MSSALKSAMIMAGMAAINASRAYAELPELKNEFWVCPLCRHEQSKDFAWCGKNLKCQGCGSSTYYKEWLVRG